MNNWEDEKEYSNNSNLAQGTKAGGSMHEPKGKQIATTSSQSHDMNKIKEQVINLTKMLNAFKQDNDQIKNEMLNIKNKLTSTKSSKQPVNKTQINNNNKRVKADSSSSENKKNDIIINMEARIEKQDSMLTNMFQMVSNITKQLSCNNNQKSNSNSGMTNKGGIGSSFNFSVKNNH